MSSFARTKRKIIKTLITMLAIYLILAGAIGALIKDILEEGKLKLPKREGDELTLGFIGGMIIGAAAGYFIDGNPLTSFLAGYAGTGTIQSLIGTIKQKTNGEARIIEGIIRMVAKEEGVDPDLAVRVAKCESNLNPKAVHINKDGSRDRGLFQINDKYHPDVPDEVAFDPIRSTRFFCKAFKEGHLNWWNATRDCWDRK